MTTLDTKQRHEVRRKLRRLSEEGTIEYRFVNEGAAVPATMNTFFKMFVESRQDKANFMTEKMESFFRLLADTMAKAGMLRLGVLELDGQPLAEIMCFDYHGCIYLYNSGYDPRYTALSAGLLSKVLAIKDSIEKGKRRFDFLKGAETYKYHLGGREVPLFRCQITI
jgi:CelD/BcsL family acetyltransferase involved in cellulose biosynthesis